MLLRCYTYSINSNIIRILKNLYDKATSAVFQNSNIGDWFHTSVGVRQGCLVSPTLFNVFLERIMTEALQHHEGTVSIGGRTVTNLRFAGDLDGLVGKEEELVQLVERLDPASTAFGMEISGEKTKIMKRNKTGFQQQVKIGSATLEQVHQFKYLGAVVSDKGTKPEISFRIAQVTSILTKLKPLWRSKISIKNNVRLMSALVQSIFLYSCESWAITSEIQKKLMQFFFLFFSELCWGKVMVAYTMPQHINRSSLLILDLKDGKLLDSGKQEEGKMFHKLHVLGMNDDLWDRVCGLDSETLKGCERVELLYGDKMLPKNTWNFIQGPHHQPRSTSFAK